MRRISFRNPNDTSKEDMNKFWNVFIRWISQEQIRTLYFSEEYINSTGTNYESNLEFYNQEYILYLTKEYPFFEIANYGIEEEQLIDFLSITCNRWVLSNKKDEFSIEVNKQLRKAGVVSFFQLMVKLIKVSFPTMIRL